MQYLVISDLNNIGATRAVYVEASTPRNAIRKFVLKFHKLTAANVNDKYIENIEEDFVVIEGDTIDTLL